MRKSVLTIALQLSVLATGAWSQETGTTFVLSDVVNKWTDETGIVMTASGRDFARQTVALEIGSQALTAGVEPLAAAKWAKAFAESGVAEFTDDGITTKGGEGEVHLKYTMAMRPSVSGIIDYKAISMRLVRFPRVIILVEPVPPHDYNIQINNMKVPITERNEYGVEPGLVSVKVTRTGKMDCQWQGQLAEGEEFPLKCKM